MFEIPTFTEARIASVTNRTEAHGEERVPAVSLNLEFEFENTRLDLIDPTLRHALYKPKPDSEPELPEIEQSTPVLRSNSIDRVKLITAHEGWTLKVDDNLDADDPLVFGSCKVDSFTVEPKQGGTIVLRCRVGTSDVDAERLGYLGVNNGQAVWVKLLKPEKPAAGTTEATGAEIDGSKGHPGADPNQGSLLDTDAAGEGGDDGLGTFADDMARGGDASIDPAGAARSEGPDDTDPDDDGSGHADSGAAEQAELEAGMSASIEASKPKRGARAKAAVGAVE